MCCNNWRCAFGLPAFLGENQPEPRNDLAFDEDFDQRSGNFTSVLRKPMPSRLYTLIKPIAIVRSTTSKAAWMRGASSSGRGMRCGWARSRIERGHVGGGLAQMDDGHGDTARNDGLIRE